MTASKNYSTKKIIQFNNNVEELLALDFKKHITNKRSIGTKIYGDGLTKPETNWPSEDSVGNYTRILRFILTDGQEEKISIRCLDEYYQDLDIPTEFKTSMSHLREQFNLYLDSGTRTKYTKEPELTNRKLIDAFMWGKYIHQVSPHIDYLDYLEKKLGKRSIHQEYRITLWDVLDYIELFYSLNTQVLEYIEKNNH